MRSLLLSPHNDDAELFASFLCLRYQPHVIVCLRSFRMGEKSYPYRKFRMTYQQREEETDEAMRVLGCSWDQWEIPDNEDDAVIANDLTSLMQSWRDGVGNNWECVFAPSVDTADGNDQHNLVGEAARHVFGERVIHYTTYTRNGRDRDGEEVEFEPEWPALKLRALSCYKTQIAHPATRAHFLDAGLREYVVR